MELEILSYSIIFASFLSIVLFYYLDKKKSTHIISNLEDMIDMLENKSLDELKSHNKEFLFKELEKRKALEKENELLKRNLNNTKAIAKEASRMKIDFMANIRHEIRTPTNSMLVFADILKKEIKDKQLSTYASNIFNSTTNLLNLLNNIIELSELESGEFKIHESAVDIRNFIKILTEPYIYEANKKGLQFDLNIQKDMPSSLMIDQEKIKDILLNLLENSLKFTQTGYIKFNISFKNFNKLKNSASILFSVEDSGIGISKVNQEKIFKVFENRDNGQDMVYQTSGLGLSINKKLANLMGGDLKLQSVVGKGSVFTLVLDNIEVVLSSINTEICDDKIDFSLIEKDSTILVIDSSLDILNSFQAYFKDSNLNLLLFDNAKDAMETLYSSQVDLIIIDVEYITMDNGALSKVLKGITTAPILTLVSNRLKDIDFSKDGIQPIGHLKKPINKLELFKILLQILNSKDIKIINNNISLKNKIKRLDLTDKNLQNYIQSSKSIELNKLLKKAISSNDLGVITKFADFVEQLATQHNIKSFQSFAVELKKKIDDFNISEVEKLLKEYLTASQKFNK